MSVQRVDLIDKTIQMESMLDGTFFKVLKSKGIDPARSDYRKHITISKEELSVYMQTNKIMIKHYIKESQKNKNAHEKFWIEVTGDNRFLIHEMNRGKIINTEEFDNVYDAVAEYVLSQYC